MNDPERPVEEREQTKQPGWLDRNPKASIVLIAGVFYLILFGMCAVIAMLLYWQYRG